MELFFNQISKLTKAYVAMMTYNTMTLPKSLPLIRKNSENCKESVHDEVNFENNLILKSFFYFQIRLYYCLTLFQTERTSFLLNSSLQRNEKKIFVAKLKGFLRWWKWHNYVCKKINYLYKKYKESQFSMLKEKKKRENS